MDTQLDRARVDAVIPHLDTLGVAASKFSFGEGHDLRLLFLEQDRELVGCDLDYKATTPLDRDRGHTSPFVLTLRADDDGKALGWLLRILTANSDDESFTLAAGLDEPAAVASEAVSLIRGVVERDITLPLPWDGSRWAATEWVRWRTALVRDRLAPLVRVVRDDLAGVDEERDVARLIFEETGSTLSVTTADRHGINDVDPGTWVYQNPDLGIYRVLDADIHTPASAVADIVAGMDDRLAVSLRELRGVEPGASLMFEPGGRDGDEAHEQWQELLAEQLEQIAGALDDAGLTVDRTWLHPNPIGQHLWVDTGDQRTSFHLVPVTVLEADRQPYAHTGVTKSGAVSRTVKPTHTFLGHWGVLHAGADTGLIVSPLGLGEPFGKVVEWVASLLPKDDRLNCWR